MADATAARDKDHPHRREPGGILRVVPGPARQVHGGETCRLRRFADGLLEDRIRSRRLVSGERNAFDLDVFFPGDCSETFPDPRPDPFDFCALEVAQFDRKFHAPWNDVARSGFDPHITHRANLPAGLRPNFFAHSKDSPRCGSECVLPAIHRRRASMVGESRGHASPPIDPDDALHDPDGNAGLVEHGALLDMKLQITGHRPRPDASFGKPRWVLAVATQPVGQGNPLFVPSLENPGAEHPGRGARTKQALAEVVTLLVAPDDHFEWVPGRHLVLVEGTNYFQRAQAA